MKRSLVAAATLAANIACGASSKPATQPPLPAAPAPDDDCGDVPDPADACPILDGCPGNEHDVASGRDEDGCPGPGGIPFATDCRSDDRRFAEIAAEIRRRPKLTTLRIGSPVPGCAEAVRSGLQRAGVVRERMEAVALPPPTEHDCTRWAYFSVAVWDGGRCKKATP